MIYVYRCLNCRAEAELDEKAFSEPSAQLCFQCDLPMGRVPLPVIAQFKAKGFTKVSTEPAYRRKLSPWFGGPPENAYDHEEGVIAEQKKKTDTQYAKKHGVTNV